MVRLSALYFPPLHLINKRIKGYVMYNIKASDGKKGTKETKEEE